MERLTISVIIVSVLLLIIYDVYAVIRGGEKATISMIITTASHKRPIVAFAFGVLMGHWFW